MRVSTFVIPVLVARALAAGYGLRTSLARPTTVKTFAEGTGIKAEFVVDGVRCKGTALLFASLYEDTPGILGIETFASERTAVFMYDPKLITKDRIRSIMEAPIRFKDGTTSQVFKCLSAR